MAKLLGSKFCIESLQKDVSDVQESIVDVFSRAGPVHLPSWKFPDKISSDLDIEDLLEMYNYSEDEEERQVAHIVLLELVIDRLVLLLQGLSRYLDHLLSVSRAASVQGEKASVSIGLTVKKFWSKLVHIYSTVQQIQSQVKSKDRKIAELEDVIKQIEARSQCDGILSSVKQESSVLPPPTTPPVTTTPISKDCSFKSSQTEETAFVPCEACMRVQANLKDTSDVLIMLCQSQDISSSLNKCKKQFKGIEWLTSNDVAQWYNEQSKDLEKMNDHLSYLMSTVNPLKEQLAKAKSERKDQNHEIRCLNEKLSAEKETLTVQMKHYEHKVIEIERLAAKSVDDVKTLNRKLEHDNNDMKRIIDGLKSEVATREEHIFQLEQEKIDLEGDVKNAVANSETVKLLKDDFEATKRQLDEQLDKLKSATKELAKEQARSRNIGKQHQALQGKQDSLVKQLSDLDEENESLKQHLTDLEEKKENLEGKINESKKQKTIVKVELEGQQRKIENLEYDNNKLKEKLIMSEGDVRTLEEKLNEVLERERLIVEYPDLNGPVNPDLSGTGDIAVDMENQVKANKIRISILEEQNSALRNSITKMLATKSKPQQDPSMHKEPIALWSSDYGKKDENGLGQHLSTTESKRRAAASEGSLRKTDLAHHQSFVVGKGTSQLRNVKMSVGGNQQDPQNSSSSVAAYRQLKKSGLLHQKGKTMRAKSSSSEYQQEMFVCSKCDKMYTTPGDLDIHRSYCYGGS